VRRWTRRRLPCIRHTVTGGNVSLYNQSPAGAIDPTPTVGMVGLIEDERHVTTSQFKQSGDAIILVGDLVDANADAGLGASHFLKVIHGRKAGLVPTIDLARERSIHDAVRALIKSRLVKSAHDCSEGGLGVALAECCLANREEPIGATITMPEGRSDVLLFNEAQGRIVLTTSATNATAVLFLLEARGVSARRLGSVGGEELKISMASNELAWLLADLACGVVRQHRTRDEDLSSRPPCVP
jgi:phosphoribosylformylglycinamidine synthase